jgi:prophage regulatory protein
MRLLRIPAVKVETGYKTHASIYGLIRQGLFTKPVPIGPRSVGWPDHEVNAINVARAAGKSEEQIRDLVNRLHAQRQEMAEALGVA